MSIDYETAIVRGWTLPNRYVDYEDADEDFVLDHSFYADEWSSEHLFFGNRKTLNIEYGNYIEIVPGLLESLTKDLQKDTEEFKECQRIIEKIGLDPNGYKYYIVNRVY